MADPSVPSSGVGRELVLNGDFALFEEKNAPAHWSLWMPDWSEARCSVGIVSDGLLIDAPDRPFAVGGVRQAVQGIEGGRAYAVKAVCRLEGIVSPLQSVLIRIGWTDKGQLIQHQDMLVRGPVVGANGIARFEDVFVAPDGADGGMLSLEVKWPRGGSAVWTRVSVQPAPFPEPRNVKVGTVYFRPRESTPEQNLDLFCVQIDAAGQLGLDVVCLSEAITVIGTGLTFPDVAESIPGQATRRLGDAAKRNGLWVVAGLIEKDGTNLFNTAVLLDREGQVAGTYRKVHLPRGEWNKGITPGDTYPVFQTDFGTVAVQICYDAFFPEPESAFALQGAEIIFAPTWGTTFRDRDGRVGGENVFRVRARDNGVYMVPSVYDGNSLVIDPLGKILASSNGETGVFWCEIDLNKREILPWVGHWGSTAPRDRMPHTYGPLLIPPRSPK